MSVPLDNTTVMFPRERSATTLMGRTFVIVVMDSVETMAEFVKVSRLPHGYFQARFSRRKLQHKFIYLFIDMFYKDCQIVQMD